MRIPTPSLEEARKRLREEDSGPLLRGLRLGLTAIVVLAGATIGADVATGDQRYPSLFLLLFAQLVVVMVVLGLLRRPGGLRRVVPLAIGVVAILYLSVLGIDLAVGHSPVTALLFCAVAVGSVAMLPWGYRPQLASVAVAGLALLLNIWLVSNGEISTVYLIADVGGIGMVLTGSVLIAARMQRDRERRMLEHMKLEAAEGKLVQLGEELEQRVAERTAELEATNRELENFSKTLSQDLRSPLRAVAGFTQTLLEDYGEQLDREGLAYVERVRAASARMGHLIDGLVAVADKDGAILRDVVDLAAVARDIAAELAANEPGRGVRFSAPPRLYVAADPAMVRVVLSNLLNNAWKYTRYTAEPVVELGELDLDGTRLFFVHDNGVGFDPHDAARMFLPFQRLETEKDFEGAGLGLATVARIVQRHGGRVWAEGERDVGATVYFSLGDSTAVTGGTPPAST